MNIEQDEDATGSVADQIKGWFTGRLPGEWFTEPPEIVVDREEITIVGALPEPEGSAGSAEKSAAAEGRIKRFREETRSKRIEMARDERTRVVRKERTHRLLPQIHADYRCGAEHVALAGSKTIQPHRQQPSEGTWNHVGGFVVEGCEQLLGE